MIQIFLTERCRRVHILPLALKSLKLNTHYSKGRNDGDCIRLKIVKENSGRHTGNALLTLAFGPSATRLQLFLNDWASSTITRDGRLIFGTCRRLRVDRREQQRKLYSSEPWLCLWPTGFLMKRCDQTSTKEDTPSNLLCPCTDSKGRHSMIDRWIERKINNRILAVSSQLLLWIHKLM